MTSYGSPGLLQRQNDPSEQSSALDAVYRFLRSSSTPPTATSASTSLVTNPTMLRSTRLWQRGCTLVASLITLHSCRSNYGYCGSTEKHSNRKFSYGTLLFNYSCILLKGMEKNFHMDLLFKILDTSILHHAFISIFIALWAVIKHYVTTLMPILSYFTRFT